MAEINLDKGDAGRAHSASPGDTVVIRLPETPTSGYRWQVDAFDPAVLKPAGDAFLPPAGPGMGGRGIRELRFAVVGRYASGVKLALRRPWEGESSAVERFEATIDATK